MKPLLFLLTFLTSFTFVFGQTDTADKMIISSLKAQSKLNQYDKVEDIMRFNPDTILVSGYLGDSIFKAPKNIVFQTFDGGKNWKKIYFKGDAWIYNTHFQKDGKVWMVGSDEYVHYSSDYGTTWAIKPKPFGRGNRVLSIYMVDSLNGIAGGLRNGLAITNDNWQTAKQIQSPLDQNKFSITKHSARNNISKVQILDSIIYINQNDHIYYSKIAPIEWRTFNVPAKNFLVNQTKKTIDLYSISNKVYVLDAKLNLLTTYVKADEFIWEQPEKKDTIDLSTFLTPAIKMIYIKSVKYDFDKVTESCIPINLYKENVQNLKIKSPASFLALKDILTSYALYEQPVAQTFQFSELDLRDYFNYYNKLKAQRQEEKAWGGDFTDLLNIDHQLFLNPNKTIDMLNQQLLDTVYKTFSIYPLSFMYNEPYIIVDVVNNQLDTLKITSKYANLFSLPWTIEYSGQSFETYDPRITTLLKKILPKGFNYYDKLSAGELIYRLIEQRVINEMKYIKGN